ncbi:MAG: hypothetical protein PHO00_07925, partial [bacterium]|nr:hypothetical protein [bacterium]
MEEIKCECGHTLKIPPDYVLNETTCPACGKQVQISSSGTHTSATAPENNHSKLKVRRSSAQSAQDIGQKVVGKCNTCGKGITAEMRTKYGYFCSDGCKIKFSSSSEKLSQKSVQEIGTREERVSKVSSLIKKTVLLATLIIAGVAIYEIFFKYKTSELWSVTLDNKGAVKASLAEGNTVYLLTEKDLILELETSSGNILSENTVGKSNDINQQDFIFSFLSDFLPATMEFAGNGDILINSHSYFARYSREKHKTLWVKNSSGGKIAQDRKYIAAIDISGIANDESIVSFLTPLPASTSITIYNIETGAEIQKITLDSQIVSCAIVDNFIFASTLKTYFEDNKFSKEETIKCFSIKDGSQIWAKEAMGLLYSLNNTLLLVGPSGTEILSLDGKTLWKNEREMYFLSMSNDKYILLNTANSLALLDSKTFHLIWSEHSAGLKPVKLTDKHLIVEKLTFETPPSSDKSNPESDQINAPDLTSVFNDFEDMLDGKKDIKASSASNMAAKIAKQMKKNERDIPRIKSSVLSFIKLPDGVTEKTVNIEGNETAVSGALIATAKSKFNFNVLDAASGFNALGSDVTFYLFDSSGKKIWKYPALHTGNLLHVTEKGVLAQTYNTDFTGKSLQKYDIKLFFLRK